MPQLGPKATSSNPPSFLRDNHRSEAKTGNTQWRVPPKLVFQPLRNSADEALSDLFAPSFQILLHQCHELVGDSAVDEAVIVAERQVAHRPHGDHVDAIATHAIGGANTPARGLFPACRVRPPATAIRGFPRSRRRTAAVPPTRPAPIRNSRFESASRTSRISRQRAAPKPAAVRKNAR